MKKILLFAAMALCCAIASAAKDEKDSYNLTRADECIDEYNYDSAIYYLQLELADNPKCAKAYDMLGFIYANRDENGQALNALTKALNLYPKKDKFGMARSRYYRAFVYLNLQDTISAIADLEEAVKLQPEENDYLVKLARTYNLTQRNAEADDIYRKLIELNPGNPYPFIGLAFTALTESRTDDALKYAAKAKLLDPESNASRIIEMRVADQQKDYKGLLNKAIEIMEMDPSCEEAFYRIMIVSDSIYTSTVNTLTKKAFEDKENKSLWQLTLAQVYVNHDKYEDAIAAYYDMMDDDSAKDVALSGLIDCYTQLQDLEMVEELANTYLETNPMSAMTYIKRGDARFFMQHLDEAKEDYTTAMNLDPELGYFCFNRNGWIAQMQGDYEQALKDYNMAIALNEDYAYTYIMKGNLLIDYLGRPEEGQEAMLLCIEKDKIAEDGTCMQYAYAALGQRDKAVEVMDSIIALNPKDCGNYYDAACLYSRLKEKDNALSALRLCLEKGFRKFRHIENDDDLDFIRETPEFKELIDEFKQKDEQKKRKTEAKAVETFTYEIPLVRQSGGTYLVKAYINELPMAFILDTGCSDVSISQVESDFMLKNGYLKQSDLKGSRAYTDANGDVHASRSVNLSTIRIGDLEVKDIRAGIVPNQKAPLLLGQEVLNKFGKVEIDSKNSILRITVAK